MSKRVKEAALKAYPDKEMNGIAMLFHEQRRLFQEGYEQAEKELIPLINRLCEAILFEWKDAADLARKTLTQIKAREEK